MKKQTLQLDVLAKDRNIQLNIKVLSQIKGGLGDPPPFGKGDPPPFG